MIESELKEAQNKAHENHTQEMKMLVDNAAVLQTSAAKMAQEHQEEEDVLRKKKCKTAAEVAGVIEKYDSEMVAMEEEIRSLEAGFKNEEEQCEEFHEHFIKVQHASVDFVSSDDLHCVDAMHSPVVCATRLTKNSLGSMQKRKSSKKSESESAKSYRCVCVCNMTQLRATERS